MKTLQLLAIGLRLLGVYTVVMAIRLSLQLIYRLEQYNGYLNQQINAGLIIVMLETLLLIVAAFVMMRFPMTLANWLLRGNKEEEVTFNVEPADLERVLYAFMGVLILTSALPGLVQNALSWWYLGHSDQIMDRERTRYMVYEITTVVECTIGLFLTFRAEGLRLLLQKFRNAGLK